MNFVLFCGVAGKSLDNLNQQTVLINAWRVAC